MTRGELGEPHQGANIAASFGKIRGKRDHEFTFAGGVEDGRGTYHLGRPDRGIELRRAQRDLAEPEPGARQLTVIGGGMTGGGLIIGPRVLHLPGRLGGTAAPVVRARQHDRIGGVIADVGEMLDRRRWIAEKAQRDPARHEVEFGPIVDVRRQRAVTHHFIRRLGVALIEELAGEDPALAPPFVGVLEFHALARAGEHHPGRFGDTLVAQKPVNAAERVPEVAARLAVDGVEQLVGLAGFLGHGGAGLDDRGLRRRPADGRHASRR